MPSLSKTSLRAKLAYSSRRTISLLLRRDIENDEGCFNYY